MHETQNDPFRIRPSLCALLSILLIAIGVLAGISCLAKACSSALLTVVVISPPKEHLINQ
jgi:hypothetical protein